MRRRRCIDPFIDVTNGRRALTKHRRISGDAKGWWKSNLNDREGCVCVCVGGGEGRGWEQEGTVCWGPYLHGIFGENVRNN